VEQLIKAFMMVLVCEIGSSSQFILASLSSHSENRFMVWTGGVLALMLTSVIAVKLGSWLSKCPISPNIISGLIMLVIGMNLIWRAK